MLPSPMASPMATLTMAILTMGLEARGQQLYYGCTCYGYACYGRTLTKAIYLLWQALQTVLPVVHSSLLGV